MDDGEIISIIHCYSQYNNTKKAYQKAYDESRKNTPARKAYNNTPLRKKLNKISVWKYTGLVHNDYNKLYDSYLQSTHCDM